jgi:signal transduction histidine kinase
VNQQLPASLHVTVSPGHAQIVEPFLQDLAAAVERVRGLPEADLSGAAAMYGMIGSLPDRATARELLLEVLDGLYRAGDEEAPEARADADVVAHRPEDELFATLGHELRGPLTPIVTALHLMKMKGDAGVERERQVIERQVEHLSRLVDGMLDISRIRRGKIELTCEPIEIHAVVAKAVEIVVPLLGRHGHGLEIAVPGSGLVVLGDVARLVQIISNLITNAAKYTDPGGHIVVSAANEGDRVVLRVKDDGIGIRPELLPHVFSPFVQGERTLDRSDGGLGIGLTLVRSLVELHGGTVSVISEGEGRGSEFVVRLPLTASAAPRLAPPPA